MPLIASPPSTFYTCPGERQPASRAVHLARLSRHYPACRDCPHRADAGLVALSSRPTAQDHSAVARGLIFTADGVRGRYLNDLSRREAQQWARAFATAFSLAPTLAVGYDERPTSPDLALGVVTGLRHAGCRVVDVGQCTPPAWRFAADRRQTDGGVFVTGSGYEASWTGFDLLGPGRRPFDPRTLEVPSLVGWAVPTLSSHAVASDLVGTAHPTKEELVNKSHATTSGRTFGAIETFSPWADYEADLATEFHALRPLRVMTASLSPLVARSLARLFAPLPCQRVDALRTSQAGSPLRWEVAVKRVQNAIVDEGGDLGCAIGADGGQCALIDETGGVVPVDTWQPWLRQALAAEPWPTSSAGRHDDALRTLAGLLRTLSWSDAPLSERLGRGPND